MIGWLIALATVAGVAVLPVGIRLSYNDKGGAAWLSVGPYRKQLYPYKKSRSKNKSTSSKGSVSEQKEKTGKDGGKVSDFLPLMNVLLDLLKDFRRRLVVVYLQMNLVLADKDPADLAVHYGSAWAALGNLLPLLENSFRIKKRDLQVQCDFCASETRIYAFAHIKITLGQLLMFVFRYGIRGVFQYIKIINNRKGGAVT